MGTGVGTAIGVASDIFNYKNEKKKLEEQNKLLEQENKMKQEEVKRKNQVYKDERIDALNDKIASQNALMGASGISASSASSKAYVDNLKKDAVEDIINNNYLTEASINSQNASYNYKKNMNLLENNKNDFDFISSVLDKGSKLF